MASYIWPLPRSSGIVATPEVMRAGKEPSPRDRSMGAPWMAEISLFPSKTPTDHAGKYRFSKNQFTKAGGSSKAVSQRALVWDKSDRVSNRIVM